MLTKSLLIAGLSTGVAVPQNYQGTWSDPFFGGEYKICVSQDSSGVWYGQALVSKIGYLRGVINPTTDEWTGNYYLAGIESRRGTFAYTLNTFGTSFTGTMTETNHGSETVTATLTSNIAPSNLECFKADIGILDGTESFTMAGDWWVGSVDRYVHVDTNNQLTGSYDYGEDLATPGWYYGRVSENGAVGQLQWYDPDHLEGMYLFSAKNSTAMYIVWHGADWISDYDFSLIGTGHWADTGFGTRLDYKRSNVIDYTKANKNRCYQLITGSFEEECMAMAEVPDDDDTVETLMYPVLVFATVGMVAGLVTCAMGFMGQGSAPMAGSSSSDAKL